MRVYYVAGRPILDKTLTSEGPVIVRLLLARKNHDASLSGWRLGTADHNRKTKDRMRNNDVYGQYFNKHL